MWLLVLTTIVLGAGREGGPPGSSLGRPAVAVEAAQAVPVGQFRTRDLCEGAAAQMRGTAGNLRRETICVDTGLKAPDED